MTQYVPVSTEPVKRFFVEMLTRDIEVEDAILDLLDNCLDGILRTIKPDGETPYSGFWAKITVNKDLFQIEDNCGGIPWSEHERAFHMGRPSSHQEDKKETPFTVGVYGIGMKRAIFKMGNVALIWTQNGNDNYEIPISADWVASEEWNLDVNPGSGKMEQDGTLIMVNGLSPDISERFQAEKFEDNLLDKIQSHYSIIMQKGFKIEVNRIEAKPEPIVLRFAIQKSDDGTEVRPYIFKSEDNGVKIFLAVGLREPIPGSDKLLDEQGEVQFSSDYAGWTVICNDRVVLYCNRDELTGWGTAGLVPRYHTQFIAISGVVEFSGDPSKLPTTTTKRGLDFSSTLYQQTLNRMREGTHLFTDFTNKWKTREDVAKNLVSPTPSVNYSIIKLKTDQLVFTPTKSGLKGQLYKPMLPLPPNNASDVRISYTREKIAVNELAEELLPNLDELKDRDIRRKVGEASFDYAYKELVKEKTSKGRK